MFFVCYYSILIFDDELMESIRKKLTVTTEHSYSQTQESCSIPSASTSMQSSCQTQESSSGLCRAYESTECSPTNCKYII
jgi:hypothetical protein